MQSSDEIFIHGSRFISATRAAKEFGFVRDYVTRLCRNGVVLGQQIDSNWYVDLQSFQHFLIERKERQEHRNEELRRAFRTKPSEPDRSSDQENVSAPRWYALTLAPPALIAHARKKHSVDRRTNAIARSALSLVLVLIIVANYAIFNSAIAEKIRHEIRHDIIAASASVREWPAGFSIYARAPHHDVSALSASAAMGAANFLRSIAAWFDPLALSPTLSYQHESLLAPSATTSLPAQQIASPPVATTIINNPVVERIIERALPPAIAGVTEVQLDARLQQLDHAVSSRLAALSASSNYNFVSTPVFAQSNRIDQLSSVDISNSTWTGGSISGVSIAGNLVSGDISVGSATTAELTVTGAATSTFAAGINLGAGCVAVNGTCITGGGSGTPGGSDKQVQFNDGSVFAGNAGFTFASSTQLLSATNFVASNATTTNATSTNFFATNASTANATSTNLYASVAHFATAIIDAITNLTATNLTAINATTTNATTTKLAISSIQNSLLATNATGGVVATSTPTALNFIATSQTASILPFASSTAHTVTTLFSTTASTTNLTLSSVLNSLLITNGSGVTSGTTTLAVNFGGTGSTTLSGLLKGNGVGGVFSAVSGSDYVNGSGTPGNCVKWGVGNTLADQNSPCGSGGGSGGGTFSTTTSSVAGQLSNYANNPTDIVIFGGSATTSAQYWFDPNTLVASLAGRVGIGTTSPYAMLAVAGQVVGTYFTATSSSRASTFPYASSTALTVSGTGFFGTASTTNLVVSGLQHSLLATDATGAVVATTTIGTNLLSANSVTVTAGSGLSGGGTVALGGTITLTRPWDWTITTYGQSTSTLMNFTGGLISTASTTIGNGNQGEGLTVSGGATTTGNAYFASHLGIGTTSPGSPLSISNIANFTTATSTFYSTGGVNLTAGCFAISGNCVGLGNLSGTVGNTQGGTGQNSSAWDGIAVVDAGVWSASSTLAIYRGGTNASSFTTGKLLAFDGTSLVSTSTIGNGQLQNSSITVTAGSGLTGGGTVTLGGTITLTNPWQWNLLTTFGTSTNATTTSTWFKTGFFASSTSQLDYASSTALSATTGYFGTASTTNLTLSSVLNSLLITNGTGVTSGTSTLAVNFGGTGSTTLGGLLAGAGGSLTSATISGPLAYAGSTLSITKSDATHDGYLAQADWANFNGKLGSSTTNSLTTNYVSKWNGSAFANSSIFDNGTYIGIGTTTPAFGTLTIGSSTAPQLVLTDNSLTNNAWAFRSINNTFFLATSTYSATSTVSALSINGTNSAFTFNSGATSTFTSGLQATNINLTGAATSTAANGINLAAGCFAISGTCVGNGSGSGTVGAATLIGQLPFYESASNALTATSSIFLSTSGNVGIGTTTPWGKLSIQGTAGQTNPIFQVASSSIGTSFFTIAGNTGNVGIGTSSPSYALDVAGFINTDQYFGYKQAGQTILYASSTNFLTAVGIGAATSTLAGGQHNTALGYWALQDITTNDDNTAIGYQALMINSGGDFNTAIGFQALRKSGAGDENVAVGWAAMINTANGAQNVAVGYSALGSNSMSGAQNVAVGNRALVLNSTGGDNDAVGESALAGNTTGSDNTAVGDAAFDLATSSSGHVAIGSNALGSMITSAANDTEANTAVGQQAGFALTSGGGNIFLGNKAGDALTTGSNNIVIGYDIDAPSNTASNQMSIGNVLFGTGLTGSGTTIAGKVGIATSSPVSTLSVQGSLCVRSTGACGTTDGTIYVTDVNLVDIDLAENYATSDTTLVAGEIAALDVAAAATIKRASRGDVVLGIVSTKPGLLLGSGIANSRPVALSGRVPLKVNLEGGDIAVGDPIVLSSVPGVGTKATTISQKVAIALESYDALHQSASSTIEVFIDRGLYFAPGGLSALGEIMNFASSTPAQAPPKGSFIDGFIKNLFARITTWLADAANGIGDFFAHRVHTDELCVGDTCITPDQFKAMAAAANQSGAGTSGTGSATPPPQSTSPDNSNAPTETADTEAPVITITGENPAHIHLGDSYADLGATVADNVDQNLGYKTFLNGALVSDIVIDTSAGATDTIEYVATDQAGNVATSTRTIIIEADQSSKSDADAPPLVPSDQNETAVEPASSSGLD